VAYISDVSFPRWLLETQDNILVG